MNEIIPNEDRIAYSEILYLLGTMDQNQINKVPKDLIDFFNEASLEGYEVKINQELPRYTENFKPYTIDLFNVLNLNFWCENEQERQDAITYLLDKPVEFKLNEQMGVSKGSKGNYFQEILEKEKQQEMAINSFREEFAEVVKQREKKQKELEKAKDKTEKKENFFQKIKKRFNKDK